MSEASDRLLARLQKRPEQLPRHVAIIMDGSGRWARKRSLPRLAGHREGRKSVRSVVEACLDLGVEVLTLYTFSLENWSRPRAEVEGLMKFLGSTLKEERDDLKRRGVRLRVAGDISALPPAVRKVVETSIADLAGGTRLTLCLALSYGGRQEIVHAARGLARRIEAGVLRADDVDEAEFEAHLWTHGLPDPDLLIRTSGEMRVSNFLLWQIAYAEIWVTQVLWPDFRARHLYEAVEDYLKRERRFGRVDARPAARRGR
jgi:undecaprenyl diphosphate synthase